jgi:hypothetical protein
MGARRANGRASSFRATGDLAIEEVEGRRDGVARTNQQKTTYRCLRCSTKAKRIYKTTA